MPLRDDTSPIEYFKMFWDDIITQGLAEQTNLYSVQASGKSINTSFHEMEQFLGIQMNMSLVSLPSYDMYWSNEFRINCIADVMGLKRYESLRRFLHANDNTKRDENSGKLFKVEPVINAVRDNCAKIEQECNQSIDEQMMPAKTKKSGIQQYMPKKIHKWGFKNFIRAGKSGMIYDFFIYAGARSAGTESCGAEDVVLHLVEGVPKNKNFRIFFDNWFSTLSLLCELRNRGILATGTFRSSRIGGCPLMSEKDLKKEGRGSYDYRTDQNTGTHLLKWFDNKCVLLGSTYSGVKASSTVQRFDLKEKNRLMSNVLTWSEITTVPWVV